MNLTTDQTLASLLGADFAAARKRFGAPLCGRLVLGELHFAYRLPDGQLCDDAVVVTDGVVTRVHRQLPPVAAGHRAHGLVGCSVDDVMARLGNPSSAIHLAAATELRYDEVVLLVLEGLVVRATQRLHSAS